MLPGGGRELCSGALLLRLVLRRGQGEPQGAGEGGGQCSRVAVEAKSVFHSHFLKAEGVGHLALVLRRRAALVVR